VAEKDLLEKRFVEEIDGLVFDLRWILEVERNNKKKK
jgi:hypothetical protein